MALIFPGHCSPVSRQLLSLISSMRQRIYNTNRPGWECATGEKTCINVMSHHELLKYDLRVFEAGVAEKHAFYKRRVCSHSKHRLAFSSSLMCLLLLPCDVSGRSGCDLIYSQTLGNNVIICLISPHGRGLAHTVIWLALSETIMWPVRLLLQLGLQEGKQSCNVDSGFFRLMLQR